MAETSSISLAGTINTLNALKNFVAAAAGRGIVVEFVLFCPFYEENLWDINPMNARNNVNGLLAIKKTEAYTLRHKDLQQIQEAFVRKAITDLNGFDNIYFEICNEPYFGGVTLDWQARIASVIVDTEKQLPHKHLLAQNIANEKARIERPHPAVSIFNFHYAAPPETVAMNFGLNKVIGDDETGFKGIHDRTYRVEAWDFIMAGGAIFDHLDYSFTTDHEDGTARISEPTPGGGGQRSANNYRSSNSSSTDSTSCEWPPTESPFPRSRRKGCRFAPSASPVRRTQSTDTGRTSSI